jgi:hypothetical protein
MSEIEIIEDKIRNNFGPAELSWVVPLLGALESLGGESKPMLVESHIHETYRSNLTDADWEAVFKSNRIRWVRSRLVGLSLMEGEHGIWRLTDDGRTYLSTHRSI